MGLDARRIAELESYCRRYRQELIRLLYGIQTGHPGGSLSSTEILAVLYHEKLRVNPADPAWPDRDRFILGKGHAAPMLYLILADRGFFPREDLGTLRQLGSHLQGHPSARSTRGVDLSTGPLGLGLPAGLGMALGARLDGKPYRTYVLMGDGELQEGIVWEAAMAAAKFATDNLLAIIDWNGVQLDGRVADIMPLGDLALKWKAFGWNVLDVDGHDVRAVSGALDAAAAVRGTPSVLLARTVKGKGVSFMEGASAWHGKPIERDEYERAMQELGAQP